MDLTHVLQSIPELLEEYARLLEGKTVVACLGNTRWLGAFICINPITDHVVGASTTEDEGFRHVQMHRPDFLLVSESLHEGTGVSLVRRAERFDASIRTILITNRESTAVIQEALDANCDAICFETEEFTPVFRIVAGGGVYYPKEAAAVLRSRGLSSSEPQPVEKLTKREVEVLRGVMLGHSNKTIGHDLNVSAETVKTHVRNVISKLQARDRTHAAVLGLAMGILSLEAALNSGPALGLWASSSAPTHR